MDLLFYHVRLHCYIVIDLKIGEFTPAYSGQMNFYVSAVDNLMRTEADQRTIGIILCRSKSKTTVEYALQDIQKPIGVSTYKLQSQLPPNLEGNLPTSEQWEVEFSTALKEIEERDD